MCFPFDHVERLSFKAVRKIHKTLLLKVEDKTVIVSLTVHVYQFLSYLRPLKIHSCQSISRVFTSAYANGYICINMHFMIYTIISLYACHTQVAKYMNPF